MGVPSPSCCVSFTQALDQWFCSVSVLRNIYRGFVCCAAIKHEPLWEVWRYLSSLNRRTGRRGATTALLLLCFTSTYWKGPFSHFGAAWGNSVYAWIYKRKERAGCTPAYHLGYGEMGVFLLLLEVWAVVTQSQPFFTQMKELPVVSTADPTALCSSMVLVQGVWFPQCSWAGLLFH